MADNPPDVFEEAFQASMSPTRTGERTSQAVLQRWRYFADDCIAGYPKELDDYSDDLTARTFLQKALAELRANHQKQASDIPQEIAEIDSRLRTVMTREAFPRFPESDWWLRNVPSYASRAFCDEFKGAYGIEITPRSLLDDDVDEMRRLREDNLNAATICIKARNEGWYSARRPDLLSLACKRAFPVDRGQRRLLWSWVNGEVSDQEFAARLA